MKRLTTTRVWAALLFLFASCLVPAQAQTSTRTQPLKPGLYAVLNTSEGNITVELYEKYTPIAVRNFVALAEGTKAWREPETGKMVRRPLYENMTFHRVIPKIMIQSGDPTGTSSHNCGITIADEFLPGLMFDRAGRLAMANTGATNSGGCQFFITTDVMRDWNGKYTVFGQVVAGMDVVVAINRLPMHGEPATSGNSAAGLDRTIRGGAKTVELWRASADKGRRKLR